MAIGCPHPLSVEFAAECDLAHAHRAEYGAHWFLAEEWHFGEWFASSAEAARDAVVRSVAWAKSESDDPRDMLGPEPHDRAEYNEWRLAGRAREQAYMSQPNRKSDKRQEAATLASKLVRAKRKAERLDRIRDRWNDRNFDTDELIKETGLSRRTVYNELKARFPDDAGVEHA